LSDESNQGSCPGMHDFNENQKPTTNIILNGDITEKNLPD
jgi:hypothetical protein